MIVVNWSLVVAGVLVLFLVIREVSSMLKVDCYLIVSLWLVSVSEVW